MPAFRAGPFDNWVYRNVNGQVIVASKPEPAKREPTAAQLAWFQQWVVTRHREAPRSDAMSVIINAVEAMGNAA